MTRVAISSGIKYTHNHTLFKQRSSKNTGYCNMMAMLLLSLIAFAQHVRISFYCLLEKGFSVPDSLV